jgi:quercetin dioxygenase-like cupin family protein
VWHVLEGSLRITIGGETMIAGPGFVGVVPPNVKHSVVALSDGRATVVDTPRRTIPGV